MCSPSILFGTAVGGVGATGPIIASTTSGLFGSAGVFGFSQAFSTLSTMGDMFSSFSAGRQQSANYEQYARINEYNARIAQNNAIMAKRAADYEADLFDERQRILQARQDVGFAHANVVINQDTPLELSVDTAVKGAVERNAILYRGATAASAEQATATGRMFAAASHRVNAASAMRGGIIGAGTSLLSGAATHYNRYGGLTV